MGSGKMAQQIKPLVAKPDNLNLILGTTLRRRNKPAHTGCHCDLTYMQSFIHTEKKKCKRQYKGWRGVHVLPAQAGVQIHIKSQTWQPTPIVLGDRDRRTTKAH